MEAASAAAATSAAAAAPATAIPATAPPPANAADIGEPKAALIPSHPLQLSHEGFRLLEAARGGGGVVEFQGEGDAPAEEAFQGEGGAEILVPYWKGDIEEDGPGV